MFFLIRKIETAAFPASHLYNPLRSDHPMILSFYQTEMATAVIRVRNRKMLAEYRDTRTGATIPPKKWTEEMQRYYRTQSMAVKPGTKQVRLTVVGYLFILLVLTVAGMLIFNALKPRKQVIAHNLEEQVRTGDIYFGRFQEMTPAGVLIRDGYAWFKVKEIKGDTVLMLLGQQTAKEYGKDEQLSNTAFVDSVYKTTIRSQKNYEIDFRTANSEMMFTAARKK